jgi:hypothetical protein
MRIQFHRTRGGDDSQFLDRRASALRKGIHGGRSARALDVDLISFGSLFLVRLQADRCWLYPDDFATVWRFACAHKFGIGFLHDFLKISSQFLACLNVSPRDEVTFFVEIQIWVAAVIDEKAYSDAIDIFWGMHTFFAFIAVLHKFKPRCLIQRF